VANPAIILDRRSMKKEFAIAKRKKLTTEVNIDKRRTGLLP
jgi:hypothetical protein